MQKLIPTIAAAAIALTGGIACAQFVDTAPAAVTTISEVLNTAKDEQLVTLEGRITKKIGHEKYQFADQTGTIVAELDDKVFAGRRVTPQNLLRVEAEVDKDLMKTAEIEIHKFEIVR